MKTKKIRGFTLVEVLISLSITSLALTLAYSLMFSMFNNFSKIVETLLGGKMGIGVIYKIIEKDLERTYSIQKVKKNSFHLELVDGKTVEYYYIYDPKQKGIRLSRMEIDKKITNSNVFFLKSIWSMEIVEEKNDFDNKYEIVLYDNHLRSIFRARILGSWVGKL